MKVVIVSTETKSTIDYCSWCPFFQDCGSYFVRAKERISPVIVL